MKKKLCVDFTLRLNKDDHTLLKELASKESKNLADYLRDCIRTNHLLSNRLTLIKDVNLKRKAA